MNKRVYLVLAIALLLYSCKNGKSKVHTLDDYASTPGQVVQSYYPDSTPCDILFYRLDSVGHLTDEVIREVHCYDNRNIYMEGGISKEKRDGEWNAYFKDGKMQSEAIYKDGQQVGTEKVYYENGRLMYEAPYENGQLHGTMKEYYQNGTLKKIINYQNGLKSGVYKHYFDNGKLMKDGQYANDICCGKWTIYTRQGKVKQTIEATEQTIVCGNCLKCAKLRHKIYENKQ